MTDQKPNLIVLAGLLHDVGKLFERGEVFKDARSDDEYLKSCPTDAKGGYATHLHAAHTAAFCDWLEARFDCLRHLTDRRWKIWCAAHHRNDERDPEASVIRISDRLSSSEREDGAYYRSRIHQKTLLEPVLERVFLEGFETRAFTSHRYPLVRLDSEKAHLFAAPGEALDLASATDPAGAVAESTHWNHLISEKPLKPEYESLCNELLAEIEALGAQCPELSLGDLIATLMTLLERYTANVPSATNLRHPDISLFDHLRTTAAIAQALHLFQENEGRHPTILPENDDVARWTLVCGDFSGIQKFL